MRGSPACVVMRPNVPELKLVAGVAPVEGVEQVERLEPQLRAAASRSGTSLEIAMSICQNAGPTAMLRGRIAQGARRRQREGVTVEVVDDRLPGFQVRGVFARTIDVIAETQVGPLTP